MKQLLSFIRKEFWHVLRDRKTLFILIGMPVVQILIFGFALSNEVKETGLTVMDHSHSIESTRLINKVSSGNYFNLVNMVDDTKELEAGFKNGSTRIALIIPSDFHVAMRHENFAGVEVIADASDPNNATVLTNYLSNIIRDFQMEMNPNLELPYQIMPQVRMLYNPQLKGAHNFVPGVMALVLMLICVMMTSVAIVREKETGTMEILLVSPFNPLMVIFAKAIPYLIVSLLNVTSILLLSVFVLDLPINGSLVLLYAESTLFIMTCLTLGIFISIRTSSQQVAMLISLMGMMLPTILFSGFMFPIENMPKPLQVISNIVPAKWYYIIIKSVMIKGLGLSAIYKETLVLMGMTLFLFIISIKNFKIRLT